jgi:hypothetical protein
MKNTVDHNEAVYTPSPTHHREQLEKLLHVDHATPFAHTHHPQVHQKTSAAPWRRPLQHGVQPRGRLVYVLCQQRLRLLRLDPAGLVNAGGSTQESGLDSATAAWDGVTTRLRGV